LLSNTLNGDGHDNFQISKQKKLNSDVEEKFKFFQTHLTNCEVHWKVKSQVTHWLDEMFELLKDFHARHTKLFILNILCLNFENEFSF